MYRIEYIIQKFKQAVIDLATGNGDARSRVDEARRRFLHIKADDLPEELRECREEIDNLLTRLPGRKGYIINDNLRKMKNKTAAKIAYLILNLYFELVKIQKNSTT